MSEKLLSFTEAGDANVYGIKNRKGDFLGLIQKHRVGRYMHWCFFPDEVPLGDIWFSNGCLKEIVAFITSLYRKKP